MVCKKIQGLLKTDYLDRELKPEQEREVKEHLLECAQCRSLAEELELQRCVFQRAGEFKPPESVWNNIREAIVAERLAQENCKQGSVLGRLREFLFRPQPVFVLATAMAVVVFVLFFAGALMRQKASLNKSNGEESTYLLYDLGTNIEEYFL